MRRFNLIVMACCALLALAAPASAQRSRWFYNPYRTDVVQTRALPDSPENLVRFWYEKYFNREPDPSGMATWAGSIRNGQAPEAMLAGILNSDEYYNKAGGTPEGLIQTLFTDVVGRAPTAAEFDYWMNRYLQAGGQDVAYALITRYPQSWTGQTARAEDFRSFYRRPAVPFRR